MKVASQPVRRPAVEGAANVRSSQDCSAPMTTPFPESVLPSLAEMPAAKTGVVRSASPQEMAVLWRRLAPFFVDPSLLSAKLGTDRTAVQNLMAWLKVDDARTCFHALRPDRRGETLARLARVHPRQFTTHSALEGHNPLLKALSDPEFIDTWVLLPVASVPEWVDTWLASARGWDRGQARKIYQAWKTACPAGLQAFLSLPSMNDGLWLIAEFAGADLKRATPRPLPLLEMVPGPSALVEQGGARIPEELTSLRDAWVETDDPAMGARLRRVMVASMEVFRRSLQSPLAHGRAWVATLNYTALAEPLRDELAEAARLVGRRPLDSLLMVDTHEHSRAFASSAGRIRINPEQRRDGTLFHELGHHLGFSDPSLDRLACAWRDQRASGKPPVSLKEAFPDKPYRDDEVAVDGSFFSLYVGKLYEGDTNEVVSMGFEHFFSSEPMTELFLADAEHFALIVGMLCRL